MSISSLTLSLARSHYANGAYAAALQLLCDNGAWRIAKAYERTGGPDHAPHWACAVTIARSGAAPLVFRSVAASKHDAFAAAASGAGRHILDATPEPVPPAARQRLAVLEAELAAERVENAALRERVVQLVATARAFEADAAALRAQLAAQQ